MSKTRSLLVGVLALVAALLAATAARAAAITVDETSPGVGAVVVADDMLCSLREAIDNANDTTTGQPHPDCAPGDPGGGDSIVLPPGDTFTLPDASVLNDAMFGNTGLPPITSPVTIEGNGATIERDAALSCFIDAALEDSEFRLLVVPSGGSLAVEEATLRNGCADASFGATHHGGGILALGSLTLRRTTMSANRAVIGGAVSLGASSLIESSTFAENFVIAGLGGAINWVGNGVVRNSTFSGHSADFGGALSVVVLGTITLEHVTFADNTATSGGGGIWVNNGTVQVKNVLLSASSCGSGGEATSSAAGVNLDTGTSCANLFGSNFIPNATDGLGPLDDNGGPTETHALLAGSQAIDAAGDCTSFDGGTPIVIDQRGRLRPRDGDGDGSALCDVGAFELAPASALDIPALSPAGLAALVLLLAAAGLALARR